jgi:indole-3-glycerol phosphate synthase
MTILDDILAHKLAELVNLYRVTSLSEVQRQADHARPPLDFLSSLKTGATGPALIAECKRASPSRGVLAKNIDPLVLSRWYAQNGASAISVLTDERFFHGSLDDLRSIAAAGLGLPLLRKDFILDDYQVYEARAAGADAILLIVAALDGEQLHHLHNLAYQLGMCALLEIHHQQEIETALACRPKLIGINNRDLHDFSTRLETTLELRPSIPRDILVVAESGIKTKADVHRLASAGIDAILVGEALVMAPDIPAKVRSLA